MLAISCRRSKEICSYKLFVLFTHFRSLSLFLSLVRKWLSWVCLPLHVPYNTPFVVVLLNDGISTERPINGLGPNNLNRVDLTIFLSLYNALVFALFMFTRTTTTNNTTQHNTTQHNTTQHENQTLD